MILLILRWLSSALIIFTMVGLPVFTATDTVDWVEHNRPQQPGVMGAWGEATCRKKFLAKIIPSHCSPLRFQYFLLVLFKVINIRKQNKWNTRAVIQHCCLLLNVTSAYNFFFLTVSTYSPRKNHGRVTASRQTEKTVDTRHWRVDWLRIHSAI